jgi:CRP/FNR family cyclic AMP-dependent transcriptional regulator
LEPSRAIAESTDFLAQTELLRGTPESELELLLGLGRRQRCPSGQVIYSKYDEGHEILFVADGRIKIVSHSPSGTNMILSFVERGEFFGELAMLDGGGRHHDAIAVAPSEILAFSRDDFLGMMRRCPEVAIRMSAMLSMRIRQLGSLAEDAVLFNSGTRLVHRIQSLATAYGRKSITGEGIMIKHELSQQEIADSVGLTRVSVNRHLRQWQEEGLIEYGRGYILVPNMARLGKLTQQSKRTD